MRILNFGSLNIDYVYSVEKFVSPGETISSSKMERFCGGKGLNQSIALSRAGANVFCAGCIGSDGMMLIEELKNAGVNTDLIKIVDFFSGNAVIQVNHAGQNSIILFGGANQEITHQYVDEVLKGFGKGDYILLQNEISNLDYIVDCAHEKGIEIVLNPSPINKNLFKARLGKIRYFILNEIEGNQLTGKTNSMDIINSFHNQYPKSKVVLTLGNEGVVYYDGEKIWQHGVYDFPVVDTTAAGDTFTGYFLARLAIGECTDEVLKKASIAASMAVSIKGAANSIPDLNRVEQYCENSDQNYL